MFSAWGFPTSITVNGREYEIRTDYRVVIDLLTAMSDPNLKGETAQETSYIMSTLAIKIMVVNNTIFDEDVQGLLDGITEFIDMGKTHNKKVNVRTMDWQQDADMIIPAVNRVLGKEIRAERYIHWWTFLSAYLEIGECTFSHILNLRLKKAKGKKLEKWELEYIRENSEVVNLRSKLTDEQEERRKAEKEAIANLIG